ncbi:MAG: radical SAM protein [Chloroflexi bacterium]|jgi:DNA repair photolyase|nr:radical SAM protein [Chloroflexota bacterium]
MIHEIQAKTLLAHITRPDPWFGIKYNMNIYRGCQHQCIYCDSRSECYGIEDFTDVLVKVNAIELLERELPRKRVKGLIGTGSMSDPYLPAERDYRLTRQALEVIARLRFPVHLITKSDLVLRDADVLADIQRVRAAVSFTITTPHDDLALRLEPGAPPSSRRFAALADLAARGIEAGVTMMPILPWIEDAEEDVVAILRCAADCGARYVMAGFGLTMRDRQRAYFYRELDRLFPGLRERYERAYGDRYSCPPPNVRRLQAVYEALCEELGLERRVRPYLEEPAEKQLPLF